MALVELSKVEQRYRAVLAVLAGAPVVDVAARHGVSRQSLHTWLSRYRADGLGGLVDRSRRPDSCAHQASAQVEAAVCELRREHPGWGPRRLVHELERIGRVSPVPSRMTVHRILVRHGLITPGTRKRPRESYRRWQRDEPMQLWQLDIVGGVMLADGTEAKVVTAVDDCSRFCVIAAVVPRATGRAVCLAFVEALRRYGIPDEALTDNGKQFTARFGRGGEVLFDRICRENAITHRLTEPASPTTTGKIERFHGTLRREFLDHTDPFASIEAAQAAVDTFVTSYNCDRPHQALDMGYPTDRFAPSQTVRTATEALLPLRVPAVLEPVLAASVSLADPVCTAATRAAPPQRPEAPVREAPVREDADAPPLPMVYRDGPVEFERVVPTSGNLGVCGKQFWLGPVRAGQTITFWADHQLIHLLIAGTRIKTVRSHLSSADLSRLAATGGRSAGPSPLPPADPDGSDDTALEVDRTVSRGGLISLGAHRLIAADILGGRRVTIRLDHATLMVFDPDTHELLRTRPNPLTYQQARTLRGARPAGPPPHPRVEPVTVQRRVSTTGTIMVARQVVSLGRTHARTVVTVHVADNTMTIEFDDGDRRTLTRTTTQPVRSWKAHRPRKSTHIS